MPKPELLDSRFDFRGGRNSSVSPDNLSVNELVTLTNARISSIFGAFSKRSGTQRMHTTAIGGGSPVRGLIQWDSPSGKQIVAISNGDLWHKTSALGDFTQVSPGAPDKFSTTIPAQFATFRAASSGAPLVLFIASGGKYYKWTGTVLTRIDGVNNAPTADLLRSYHTRIFARQTNLQKHVFWSRVGDGEFFTTGAITDGGSAMADFLTGDAMVALEVVGGSLIIATSDSLVRFTGNDANDIKIAQDTEGISSEVGVVGPLALIRVETVAALLSDKGPYLSTEADPEPIGVKVEPDFDALDRSVLSSSVLGWHRGRREIFYAVPGVADSSLNKTVFTYAARLQTWEGPWTYPFGITYLTRYQDATGDEWLIAGCADGFVRHMDTGALDDVLANGTGGSVITMTVELPPIFFQTGPGSIKALETMRLQADLPIGSSLQ